MIILIQNLYYPSFINKSVNGSTVVVVIQKKRQKFVDNQQRAHLIFTQKT